MTAPNAEIREVFSVDDGRNDYEWSELHVYVHPANGRRFALHEDSGCSCNYYEQPTVAELRALQPVTMTEARKQISAWLDAENYSPDSKARELERAHLALRARGGVAA